MPKKKFRDTPEKQKARFIATAKQLGYDESGKSFERVLKHIAQPPMKIKQKKP